MTSSLRIIPRLDIKGPHLVKGIHLEGLRVLGDPASFARHYANSGADELLYVDVVASLYGRNSALDLLQSVSRSIHIPVAVGGAVESIEDVRRILRSGADKVVINSAAARDPALVHRIARQFGSSTLVVSINCIKRSTGSYEVMIDGGRQPTGLEAIEWAKQCQEAGAGEILVNSIDKDGTGHGFDIELVSRIVEVIEIPLIVGGGAGRISHFDEIATYDISAIAASSIFHYLVARQLFEKDLSGSREGNFSFISGSSQMTNITALSIEQVKNHLLAQGIPVRHLDNRSSGGDSLSKK